MSSLEDVLQIQKDYNILLTPPPTSSQPAHGPLTDTTVQAAIKNNTGSSTAYVYVSGLDSSRSNAVFLLQSDGVSTYYPVNPPADTTVQPLQANCAIPLGAPGTSKTVTLPRTSGGRIWLVKDATLTFALNPGANGPALVEPSATATVDPNYYLTWDFCEYTFDSTQLFVNVSFVDFVSMPVALQLENTSGTITTVQGMAADGLETVVSKLQAQAASDGADWGKLAVTNPTTGALVRVLNPTKAISVDGSLFQNYWQPYVDDVWSKYSSTTLTLDTQSATWGTLQGQVTSDSKFTFPNVGAIPQPSAADIFSCNSGAFARYDTNGDEMGNISARLSAAFNRSTLLIDTNQPDGESVSTYYQHPVTNHYSRVCHEVSLDGRGYAFAYDDVGPGTGVDQSGSLYDPNPKLLTVTVGGPSGSSRVRLRDMARAGRQLVGGQRQHVRRAAVSWASAGDEKRALVAAAGARPAPQATVSGTDLEKGAVAGEAPRGLGARPVASLVPEAWRRRAEAWVARLEASPAYARAKPALDLLVRCAVLFMSLSLRALVSRASMALFLVLLYCVVLPLARQGQGAPQGAAAIVVDPVSIAP